MGVGAWGGVGNKRQHALWEESLIIIGHTGFDVTCERFGKSR